MHFGIENDLSERKIVPWGEEEIEVLQGLGLYEC